MNRIFIRFSAFLVFLFVASVAHADERVTEVTDDISATNGCEVSRVAGYGGSGGGTNFYTTIYEVDCPGEPVINPEKTVTNYSWGYQECEMETHTSGYYLAGHCGDYSIYKED